MNKRKTRTKYQNTRKKKMETDTRECMEIISTFSLQDIFANLYFSLLDTGAAEVVVVVVCLHVTTKGILI